MVTEGAPLLALAVLLLAGCDWTPFRPPPADEELCVGFEAGTGKPVVSMHFGGDDDFFAAPFPAMGRDADPTGANGAQFPAETPLAFRLRNLVSTDGYALSAGIFFELSQPADPSVLPTYTAPTAGDAGSLPPAVMLFPLDDPGHPAALRVTQAQMPASANAPAGHVLLNVLPVQGLPLRENSDYVALVTTTLGTADGATMGGFCNGGRPPSALGLTPKVVAIYRRAVAAAESLGLDCSHQIAAMSVFHTTDPTAAMRAVQALAHADYANNQTCGEGVPLTRDMDGPGYRCPRAPFCVYAGTAEMPQYQRGTSPFLPYLQWGGGWPSSPVPAPETVKPYCTANVTSIAEPTDPTSWAPTWRTARVVVTIPHTPPPAAGYPVVVLVRAGAGGFTDPVVDRGPELGPSCNQAACRGPAEVFQSAGFAAITIDGPLTGESRLDPAFGNNEDFNIYNFLNPIALRDNLRQSAVELTLVPDILAQIQIDLEPCEGAGPGRARFDLGHLAMFSHSMGSSISPLALAGDSRYRLAILSGSGGSLIENVVYKAAPLPIYVAGSLLNLPQNCQIDESPPALSLLQWATEPSDTQVYARRMVSDAAPPGATWWSPNARSILMIQGLVDHDILPPIADVMTLGEGLDLGLGPGSCFGNAECDTLPVNGEIASASYPSIAGLLGLSGHAALDLASVTGRAGWPRAVARPAGFAGALTATVVQHRIDQNREPLGQECTPDGHEVIFESTLARHQYGCFLYDFAHDRTPAVRPLGEEFASCDP